MRRIGKSGNFDGAIEGFVSAYVSIGVAIFIFLTLLLLPDHAALYLEILKALGIFGAGAAGGYGLRAYQDRRPGSPRDS